MSDKTFRDFIARMNQIGQVAHIFNPLDQSVQCRVELGSEGVPVTITLPPGGELRFVVSTYDTRCLMERPFPAQPPRDGEQQRN